jgi:hypothetical protein
MNAILVDRPRPSCPLGFRREALRTPAASPVPTVCASTGRAWARLPERDHAPHRRSGQTRRDFLRGGQGQASHCLLAGRGIVPPGAPAGPSLPAGRVRRASGGPLEAAAYSCLRYHRAACLRAMPGVFPPAGSS